MSILDNYQLTDLPMVSKYIIETGLDYKIWIFEGEMGVGKTTLIKAICKNLGVMDEVSSPTFSIVNEYKTVDGKTVYHFDFYRVKSIEEVYDIGVEDYFYSGNICLVEWPEKIKEILTKEKALHIFINQKNEQRFIEIN